MPDLGPHVVYIVWAYAGVALATLGLIGLVIIRSRQAVRRLEALEAQGLRRRSAGPEA